MTHVSRETFGPEHFFDLTSVSFAKIFEGLTFPWEALRPGFKEDWIRRQIRPNVSKVLRNGTLVMETTEISVGKGHATIEAGAYLAGNEIELQAGAIIEAGAWVTGPTILGPETAVRHGAYVRGGVLTGEKAVIGHTTEVKSSILLNHAKAPHFAYLGDSILGNHVNLGAGTKVSNLKMTGDEIFLRIFEEKIPTKLRKMGAIVGDSVETGCNSVLNPGVLLGKKCMVFPAIAVRKDYYKPGSVIK